MGFVSIALKEAREPETAEEGEYDLLINSAEPWHTDNGDSIHCVILFEGRPEYQPIHHYIGIPSASDPDEKAQNKLRFARRFVEKFGIEFTEDGFDTEDLIGARALCGVSVEAGRDEGTFNNKLKLPAFQND